MPRTEDSHRPPDRRGACLVGLGHAAAPWMFGYSDVPSAVASNLIAGLALAVFAGLRVAGVRWAIWPACAVCLWMLAAPIALGYGELGWPANEALWSGLAGLALCSISAMAGLSPDRETYPTALHPH